MSKTNTLRLINLLRDRFKNINMQILGLVNDLEELKWTCRCGHNIFSHQDKLGVCLAREHSETLCKCDKYEGILYE